MQIYIWNHRPAGAEKLAKHVKETQNVDVMVFNNVEECVKEADVIVAATSTTEPVLKEYSMKSWVHINCKILSSEFCLLPVLINLNF